MAISAIHSSPMYKYEKALWDIYQATNYYRRSPTYKELSRLFGESVDSLYATVFRLLQEGLVLTERLPADRRKKLIVLTGRGRILLSQARQRLPSGRKTYGEKEAKFGAIAERGKVMARWFKILTLVAHERSKYDIDIHLYDSSRKLVAMADIEHRLRWWVEPDFPSRFATVHVPVRKKKFFTQQMPTFHISVNRPMTNALIVRGDIVAKSPLVKLPTVYTQAEWFFDVPKSACVFGIENIEQYILKHINIGKN